MLDKIKDLFKEGLEYTHVAGLLQQLANINNILNAQYMKSSEAKNEAIDHVCALLQKHKDVIVALEKVEVVPEANEVCSNASA